MRMPHMNLSPVTLSEAFGFYLLIRLRAVAALGHIHDYFQRVEDALTAAIGAHQMAIVTRRAAVAMRDHQNDRMNQEIRVLAFTILGVVNNARTSPFFRHYFPQGFSEVLRTPVAEQRRRAVVLLEKLQAEKDEVVKLRLEPFRERLEEFEGALQALENARDAEARERSNREAAKVVWLDGYRRTYQMLQDHYSTDPQKAEEFFRPARTTGPAVDPEDDLDEDGDDFENLEENLDADDEEAPATPARQAQATAPTASLRAVASDIDDDIAGLPTSRAAAVPRVAETQERYGVRSAGASEPGGRPRTVREDDTSPRA